MAQSASELFCKQVNDSRLSEWKNKIDDKLHQNEHEVGKVTEESIVNYAMEFIYEYHNRVNNGHLEPNNRLPNDDDIEAFAKIGVVLLYEWQSIPEYGKHHTKVQERLQKKISDKLEEHINSSDNSNE